MAILTNLEHLSQAQLEKRIKIAKYLKLQKMQQTEKNRRYSTNFGLWLTERFNESITSIEWSKYGGAYLTHKWDGTEDPFLVITKSLSDRKWVGVESGTGTGKSYMCARVVYWFLDTWGGTVITTAPKQQQLKDVLWKELQAAFPKFKRLNPYAEMFNLRIFPDGKLMDNSLLKTDADIQSMKITKAIGIVAGVGANEESAVKMQGYHDDPMLIVVDEAAGISPAVMTAVKNTCTDPENNLILAMGNPDNMTDPLHEFCELDNVVSVRISAKDHPNVVLKRKVIPGAVTQSSIDLRQLEYGDKSPFFESRVSGRSPRKSSDSLFSLDWLEDMLKDIQQFEDDPEAMTGYNAVGCDAANSLAGDMAALFWGKQNIVEVIQEFHCPDASHLGYNLVMDSFELAEKGYHDYQTPTIQDFQIFPQCVGVDGVGIGISTVQALWNSQYPVVSLIAGERQWEAAVPSDTEGKPLFKFADLRSQMFWELSRDAKAGDIKIRFSDRLVIKQLFKELMAHKYTTRGGRTRVLSKDDIKKVLGGKSPNLADSFAYWNWVRKGWYMGNDYIPLM
jgi:hypothetical protein